MKAYLGENMVSFVKMITFKVSKFSNFLFENLLTSHSFTLKGFYGWKMATIIQQLLNFEAAMLSKWQHKL